ncbi:MAG: glycosyltransferase family A protein [Beijerinckiaceae bacterium]|jgi:hypothetical protein
MRDHDGALAGQSLAGGFWAQLRRFLPRKAVKIGDSGALIETARTHVARFDGARLIAVPRGATVPAPKDLRLAIIIPTRLKPCTTEAGSRTFIERAMESALAQALDQPLKITFIAGVDVDADVPARLAQRPDLVIARSTGRSQILALNAAIAAADQAYNFVAFLEDDDLWAPEFLAWSLLALVDHDFVSMSHVEIDESGKPVNIQDFPTPSSWLMLSGTLARVGAVDLKSKWHYDNDWLGRLGDSGLRRCHLVEKAAPLSLPRRLLRPGIGHLLRDAGPNITLLRHASERPLVIRLVHSGSGTAAVQSGGPAARESKNEYKWLIERYGRIPW